MPERPEEMFFPFFGLDVSMPFDQQRKLTTADAQNVRGFDPVTGRGKGASRPGLSRLTASTVAGSHLIQHLAVVVSVDGEVLLDNYDDPSDGFVGDPSDGGRGRGRRVRDGGSGRQPWKLRKRTPIVEWDNPVDIEQGTALDGTQLNATGKEPSDFYIGGATIAGTYDYTPPSGTVLPEGNGHVLTVQFTPSDTLTWRTPPKKKVRINVTASGSPPGVGTAQVTAVDAPNSCTVDNVIIDGVPAPGAEIDYHAGGWPAGRKPVAPNTYDVITDALLTYRFTSFTPDAAE